MEETIEADKTVEDTQDDKVKCDKCGIEYEESGIFASTEKSERFESVKNFCSVFCFKDYYNLKKHWYENINHFSFFLGLMGGTFITVGAFLVINLMGV